MGRTIGLVAWVLLGLVGLFSVVDLGFGPIVICPRCGGGLNLRSESSSSWFPWPPSSPIGRLQRQGDNGSRGAGLRFDGRKDRGYDPQQAGLCPCGAAHFKPEGVELGKPNYQHEKRQKDLAKKKKQEEKRQRKLAAKKEAGGQEGQEQPPAESREPLV